VCTGRRKKFIVTGVIALGLLVYSHPIYISSFRTLGQEGYFQFEEGIHTVYTFWTPVPRFSILISLRPHGWFSLPRILFGDALSPEVYGTWYWGWDDHLYIHVLPPQTSPRPIEIGRGFLSS